MSIDIRRIHFLYLVVYFLVLNYDNVLKYFRHRDIRSRLADSYTRP